MELAKTYFDVREYRRAAHLLATCSSHRAVFLRGYSLYLAGEKRKEDLHIESPGSSGASKSSAAGDANSELKTLYRQFSDAHKAVSLDGLGLYLYGIVLKALQLHTEARAVLQESVAVFPLNWGAWLELASLCHSPQQVSELTLAEHWIKAFFTAHTELELQGNKKALVLYQSLQVIPRP